jgi:hypothetical protein
VPAVTLNPADSISLANSLASISVGKALVRLADGARDDVARHCCGVSTETYQRFLMARIDPSPARWKHGDVVKRLLICRCNSYDNGDGRALTWVRGDLARLGTRRPGRVYRTGIDWPHFSEIVSLDAKSHGLGQKWCPGKDSNLHGR